MEHSRTWQLFSRDHTKISDAIPASHTEQLASLNCLNRDCIHEYGGFIVCVCMCMRTHTRLCLHKLVKSLPLI